MNKRTLKLVIGLVVLALLLSAYFLITTLTKEEEPEAPEEEKIIQVTNEDPNNIVSIAYTNSLADVAYTFEEEIWKYTGDSEFPVTQSFLSTMAEGVASVNAKRDITDAGGNEADYGFSEPTLVLNVGMQNGTVHTYTVGSYNTVSTAYYLKYNGRIYMIDSTIVDACNHSLFDALTTTSLETISAEKISGININGTDITDEEKLSQLSEAYSSISVGNVENYKNAENYGFDGTENTVSVSYTISNDITDENGNVTNTVETPAVYTFRYTSIDGMYYIMLPDDELIYSVTGIDAFTVE